MRYISLVAVAALTLGGCGAAEEQGEYATASTDADLSAGYYTRIESTECRRPDRSDKFTCIDMSQEENLCNKVKNVSDSAIRSMVFYEDNAIKHLVSNGYYSVSDVEWDSTEKGGISGGYNGACLVHIMVEGYFDGSQYRKYITKPVSDFFVDKDRIVSVDTVYLSR